MSDSRPTAKLDSHGASVHLTVPMRNADAYPIWASKADAMALARELIEAAGAPDPWALIERAGSELYTATMAAMAVIELPFGSVESLAAKARAALDQVIAVQRSLTEAANARRPR